jgi:myo-inositol-1(or 4)-monophosphatase
VTLLDRLEELTREAGKIALARYGRVSFELKGDASPVSAADREVEAFLHTELCALDPGAAYIGEETARDPEMVSRARQAERVWVVDPIDGTAAFLNELDTFAICVGLLQGGRPHAGVVTLPVLEQTYRARQGDGAFWRSSRGLRQIRASADEVPAISCLLTPSNAHRSYRIRYRGKVRSFGCTAYHFLLVARGAGIGAVSRSHVWDYVAAGAVLEEAGGVLRHLPDGSAVDWLALLDGKSAGLPVLGAHPDCWDRLAQLITRD